MEIKTILYHGSTVSQSGLEEDEARFHRFVDHFIEQTPDWGTEALLILPDSDAHLKPYYCTGMARISSMENIAAVGARTDLSFSILKSLKIFDAAGGYREKLRIFAVFYPELVTLNRFINQCQKLRKENISFSVGTFGIPDHLDLMNELRSSLSPDIYIWIEPVDHLNQAYSEEEEAAFKTIDPYFSKDRAGRQSDNYQVLNELSVESDGRLRIRGTNRYLEGNWYHLNDSLPVPKSSQEDGTRYLELLRREDYVNSPEFGRYPMFRIPWKPKAFFLSADKIPLEDLPEGEDHLLTLRDRRDTAPVFLITALPYKEAARHFHAILPLCSGGIFAGGAHILLHKKGRQPRREIFLDIDPSVIPVLEKKQSEYGCQLRVFQNESTIFKLTMEKPFSRMWRESEIETLKNFIPSDGLHCFVENNCFHIISADANEKNGLRTIGRWLCICPEDCVSLENLN